jgi:hypothetical protein
MKGYKIEQVREMLSQAVLEITFTKVNGETRVMNASTNALYIPETAPVAEGSEPKEVRPPNPNLLVVVDTDIGQWRAIKFDSIHQMVETSSPVLNECENAGSGA